MIITYKTENEEKVVKKYLHTYGKQEDAALDPLFFFKHQKTMKKGKRMILSLITQR